MVTRKKSIKSTDPDEFEDELADELEENDVSEEPMMADAPQTTAKGEPKHPDPEGKMTSYAPGFGPDGKGGVVELKKEKDKDEADKK